MGLSIKLTGPALAGLIGTALLCAPAAAADPEGDFLSALDGQGVSWPGATVENMLAAGRGVCQDWAAGASFEQEVGSLQTHLSQNDAAFLIGAATAAFCPEYKSKIE